MLSNHRATRAAGLLLAGLICTACQRNDADTAANVPAESAADVTPPATQTAPPAPPALDPVPAAEPGAIVQQMPDADAPTPAIAVGAAITYACDDGTLVVTYRGPAAALVLPDGSRGTATLAVEESVKAGGEVYVGERIGLRRIGSAVELQSADAPTRRCIESGGTA